jgi:hypothetical protein
MIQMPKVSEVTRRWKEAGEPYCDHSRHDKEYMFGADSGDYACLDCGLTWTRKDPVPEPRGKKPD